jgi:ubiquinone/menaquinone biosynthesis C-methylase UbiE
MNAKSHWEKVYSSKPSASLSWYQAHADLSLRLIRDAGVSHAASIIDVGGGTSPLVDDLLLAGYTNLTVLDLSATALTEAERRLGPVAKQVRWIEGDVTKVSFQVDEFDLWHDRAVFHFLTHPADRAGYVEAVLRSVKPGGHVIVATFAEDGPATCSGLPVMRYGAAALHSEFGEPFSLLWHEKEAHHTPTGRIQQFVYCYCRKVAS